MFALAQSSVSSLVSFIILAVAFLISIGIFGSLSAHMKAWIGDSTALEEGYGSCNPFIHIDFIGIIIFFIFNMFWRVKQPFNFNWSPGKRGFFERIIYLIGISFSHLIFASLLLLIGSAIWKGPFIQFAFIFRQIPSSETAGIVSSLFNNFSSFTRISVIMMASLITVNIILSFFDLINRVINYFLMTYIFPYRQDLWIYVGSIIVIFSLFSIFETTLWTAAWKFVTFPLSFLLSYFGFFI